MKTLGSGVTSGFNASGMKYACHRQRVRYKELRKVAVLMHTSNPPFARNEDVMSVSIACVTGQRNNALHGKLKFTA